MIEWLENIDREFFLFLNSLHAVWLDEVMFFISGNYFWIPVICYLLIMLFRQYGKRMWIPFILLALCFILTDQISNLIKNIVERYRPSHNTEIGGLVHLVNGYKGGLFGFVSSHAANSFGLALLSSLFVKRRLYVIIIMAWAVVVSYSRIYLGVHYPSDIFAGALLGGLIALFVYILSKKIKVINRALKS